MSPTSKFVLCDVGSIVPFASTIAGVSRTICPINGFKCLPADRSLFRSRLYICHVILVLDLSFAHRSRPEKLVVRSCQDLFRPPLHPWKVLSCPGHSYRHCQVGLPVTLFLWVIFVNF